MRFSLIIILSIIYSGALDNAKAKSFNKYGVYINFPGDYVKAGDIGNDAIKIKNVIAETYSLESKYGVFSLTFLRFASIPKGTLKIGMQGAVHSVGGKLKDYMLYSVLLSADEFDRDI
tara:strand:- start:145 stop:498 length:354 start_codon:yes stop_codon:yes gene_type:complete